MWKKKKKINTGKQHSQERFKSLIFIGTTIKEQYFWENNAQGKDEYRFPVAVICNA
jgi:hypothetical protein